MSEKVKVVTLGCEKKPVDWEVRMGELAKIRVTHSFEFDLSGVVME